MENPKVVSELRPNPKNPRKISDEKLAMLEKSLAEFGDLSGIIFNRRSGQLAGGHQRVKAFRSNPEIKVTNRFETPTPNGTVAVGYVIVGTEHFNYREVDWGPEKEIAANIAANQHGGEWDYPVLAEHLVHLDEINLDMDLVGFTAKELENVLAYAPKTEGECEDDEVPEARVEPNVKRGDIFQLGEHRLMCGDSTNTDDIAQLMNGEKADMVFTDPPYGVNAVGGSKPFGTVGGSKPFGTVGGPESHRNKIIKANLYSPIIGDDTTETAIKAFKSLEGEIKIFWGAQCYAEALPPSQGWIVWDKDTTGNLGDGELAWTNQNRAIRIFKHTWNGLIKESEKRDRRCHPTQKPIALAEWCFENYGNPKIVLDGFLGSGSTLIACEKTGRRCFGMEIDPVYCQVILDRYVKFTGKEYAQIASAQSPQSPT